MLRILFFVMVSIVLLGGCTGKSVYVREDSVTQVMSYSDTDLKLLAEKMVSSLVSRDDLLSNKPKIWVSHVNNTTSEYIDTEGLLDKISTALLKSGKIRLVDREATKQIAKEKYLIDLQRIDNDAAVKVGKLAGADYFLWGNLMSIPSKEAGIIYYKFTLRLVSMDSEILWMEEKEIKKASN